MPVNQLNLIMGAGINRKEDRQAEDYYKTDPKALEILLDQLERDGIKLDQNVWECACGDCGLSEVLINRGYDVFSTDLISRGSSLQHLTKDFFDFNTSWNGDILTNPPYKYASEFVNHSLDLVNNNRYVIMFLQIQFLESQKRWDKLFSKNPPKYVYVFSNRAITAMNGDFDKYHCSPTRCYAWFIWEKGYEGDPMIRWLHK